MEGKSLRQRLYPEFARIGQALANDKRLELVDILAQAPRHVEALANETGMSVASVSQHLQILRNAKLVVSERQGARVLYRLADKRVVQLWLILRAVGQSRLPEVEQISHEYPATAGQLSRDEVEGLAARGEVYLVDVRPRIEYEYGHLKGAISIPLDELPDRIDSLPRDKRIVTYCRGVYCLMSDDALGLLRERGFDVARLDGGWPEWWDEGRPISALA